MRSPSNERSPGLQRPQYETRSRYRENDSNDCIEEIHLHSEKIKDLGSCLVPHSTNMPLGVQNSDNLQYIQRSAPFMLKNRDVNLQNKRKSPRLLVQNRGGKRVFESTQEGEKCRSNSQIEGLDQKKLCFPAEVILAKPPPIDNQNRSLEHERETKLQHVRKSPRLSGEARKSDMQLLFESNEKITNCRKKFQIKDLDQEKFISPAEGKLVNMAMVHNESSNDEGKRDMQNTQALPSVSGKVPVICLQSFVDSTSKICTHESHIKSTFKGNLSLKSKAAPASMPHIPNTGVSYDRVISSKSIRKSVRLSSKNGEMDLQKKNLPSGFSFATDVELTTVTQVQKKNSDCDQGTDLKTTHKSLRLSWRSRETNLDGNIECSEEGRTEPQENSANLNILSAAKLFEKPQVQNISPNSNGQVKLKNMQKSPHLSGSKRQRELQICSRKEVRFGAESQKKGRLENNLSVPSNFELTNALSAQNQIVKSNKEEINLGVNSQKKGFDGSTMSLPMEVELTSAPSLHNEIVTADGCLLNNTIGSPLSSSKSLPFFQYYVSSGTGINLVVDLNSSPLDWTKKIFSSSSQSLQMNKFVSFRHEIESLRSKKMISSPVSTFNPFNEIIPSHPQNDACSLSVSGETCPLQSYIPERDNGSSDITQTNSCIDARTRDGHVENSSDVSTETSGDNISPSQEYVETRITISETKASEQSSEKPVNTLPDPVNTLPDGSHKRKNLGRRVFGIRLKCGKHLGARKSMRLWHQGGPR